MRQTHKLYAIFGQRKPDRCAVVLLEEHDPMISTEEVSRYQKWETIKEYKQVVAYVDSKLLIYSPYLTKEQREKIEALRRNREESSSSKLDIIKES